MRSFIQTTDTNNDVLRSLTLGDLSSTTTYFFRVWNNKIQAPGIGALNGLKLNIAFPPKQGIQTLINEDTIQIRCTYSGERSESVTNSFQNFPITGDNYNRLEPNCFNEYEVRIDFSNLSTEQINAIDQIEMEYNIVIDYDTIFTPFSLPQEIELTADTSIAILGIEVQILSDTTIV